MNCYGEERERSQNAREGNIILRDGVKGGSGRDFPFCGGVAWPALMRNANARAICRWRPINPGDDEQILAKQYTLLGIARKRQFRIPRSEQLSATWIKVDEIEPYCWQP